MEISFRSKQLQQVCSVDRVMQRELNVPCAKKLRQRLMELRAAVALSDISHLPPPRLHEYGGAEKGVFSVDLQHPFRLLFIPADDPAPLKSDGGIDLTAVRSIEIIDILDPH